MLLKFMSDLPQAFFVPELLTIAIVCLAKCSTVTLILRIFTADAVKGKRWITCCALLGLSAAWHRLDTGPLHQMQR